MTEAWKAVVGFEGLYEVSSTGRLRRVATHIGNPRCRIIAPHEKRSGYLDYWLWKDGKKNRRNAHRLVWQVFVGPIPEGLQINHKNGVKSDNRLENLEVCTRSENAAHSYRVLGRAPPNYPSLGEKNGSARLKEADISEIRRSYENGEYQYVIARRYGVSQSLISLITRREIWLHVG